MGIHQEVKQELEKLTTDEQVINLALAALEGDDAVERVLAGEDVVVPDTTPDTGEQVPPVYLQDITVSGFRGIGPEATLKIPPGPGLTVVVGRNGSGKSSFAEGLEVLLTGNSYRWEDKTVVWRKGWRNLHQGDNPKISARFQVERMNKQTVVERTWSQDSKLEEGKCSAQHHGQTISDLDGIGWKEPLDLYRPILSYKELSIIEKSPSSLYDILAKALGIGDVTNAMKTLAKARLVRQRTEEEIKKELFDNIFPKLIEIKIEEPRAERVVEYLLKHKEDLGSLLKFQSETKPHYEQNPHYQDLQHLINIKIPDQEQVIKIAEELNKVCTEWSNLSGTDMEHAEHLLRILNLALEHYDTHRDNPCPVCGVGILDTNWRTNVVEQIEQQKEASQHYREVKNNMERAMEEARSMVAPTRLPSSTIVETDSLVALWEQWSSLPDNKVDVPRHLLSLYSSLQDEAKKISDQAGQIYFKREEKWLFASSEFLYWLAKASKIIPSIIAIPNIIHAENVLKSVNRNLRSARWSPIEKKALDIWKDLRLGSSVDLRSVQLAGTRVNRKVDLEVEVDGIKADALSVVSQGEISCLALAIFFPRIMLPDNPFRFLLIDDPVQSMDPARVDGLARVFSKIAQVRQLIVFTHDNRLPESLRILDIKHHCFEVRRSMKSEVAISEKRDPVIQYFFEARAILKDNDIQEDIARRVIPGFCRSGLEAACVEAVWRRWLNKGRKHQTIERRLFEAKKLSQKASLALFDDVDKGGKVFSRISGKWEKRFAIAFQDTNKGTHSKYAGDLASLINDCQSLAERLRRYDP